MLVELMYSLHAGLSHSKSRASLIKKVPTSTKDVGTFIVEKGRFYLKRLFVLLFFDLKEIPPESSFPVGPPVRVIAQRKPKSR